MSVPFFYRPGAPIPRVARAPRTFLSDVKITPDAWRQTIIQIPALPAVSFDPLHLRLFLPAALAVHAKDPIRFHIQLTGPAWLLQHFLTLEHLRSRHPGPIQCSIQRNVIVNFHGCPITRTIIVSDGELRRCTPPSQLLPLGSLNWDGEVRCDSGMVGAFDGGLVNVENFVVVEIIPLGALALRIGSIRHVEPIKFVFAE
ncbi:hypothetical protein B0H17DRAFT_1215084 [Mycena rosella]|uniref:Uncharacterized protein n=1 Tax=Mycena rosella TaxID=1033263 RepID=A0AAD7CLM7_MYCRO|nr:hypothetical protein B0H17DRAFT_1215084 [Mycena rosella]